MRSLKPAGIGFILILAAASALALEPPHDASNNISCKDCHAMHLNGGMGWGLLPRDEQQEAMCKSCHNPTGKAPDMTEVANHIVNGQTIVDCGSCHDPHGPATTTDPHPGGQTAPNLKLIRGDTKKYMGESALEPALFQQRPDHFAFDEVNPPWNGICQSCHTATDHHRNDATADHHHQTELACTLCHPHEAGFLPEGGCSLCHNQPQAARRQVVEPGGDFERASHHLAGPVQDSDCTTCHYVRDHPSGTVKLKDGDQGDSLIYSFSPADPAGLEPFCLSCHDADGAAAGRGLTPFSDGQIVPDIDRAGLWQASAHATGGATNSGYSCFGDGSTTGCHGNAHGSNLRKLLEPSGASPGPDNANEEEGFCYNCHGPGGVINEPISNGWFAGSYESFGGDVQSAFSLHSTHPVEDSAAGHLFDLGTGPRELECTTCHGVHQVSGKYWDGPAGTSPVVLPDTGDLWGDTADEKVVNYDPTHAYQSPLLGEPGTDLSGNPLPVDGLGNSLLTDTVLPDYNTLCLSCHQYAFGALTAVDWLNKKHGSASAEPEGPAGWPLAAPFSTASRGAYFLNCLDCHEAHGSENERLIKRSVNGATVPDVLTDSSTIEWIGVCDQCHDSSPADRHHNDDVWYNKLGMTSADCIRCHPIHPSAYANCVSSGCHGHDDFF